MKNKISMWWYLPDLYPKLTEEEKQKGVFHKSYIVILKTGKEVKREYYFSVPFYSNLLLYSFFNVSIKLGWHLFPGEEIAFWKE